MANIRANTIIGVTMMVLLLLGDEAEAVLCNKTENMYRQLVDTSFVYRRNYSSHTANQAPSSNYCHISHSKTIGIEPDTVCSGAGQPNVIYNMEGDCSKGCPPVFNFTMNEISGNVHNGTYQLFFTAKQMDCFHLIVYDESDLRISVDTGDNNSQITRDSWDKAPAVWSVTQDKVSLNLTLAGTAPESVSLYLERFNGDSSVLTESLQCLGGWADRLCSCELDTEGYTKTLVLVDFGVKGLSDQHKHIAILSVTSKSEGDHSWIWILVSVLVIVVVVVVVVVPLVWCLIIKPRQKKQKLRQEAQKAPIPITCTDNEEKDKEESALMDSNIDVEQGEVDLHSHQSSSRVPRWYYDFLILASEKDKEQADSVKLAIEGSESMTTANDGTACRVEMIEEATGEHLEKLSIVDKAVKLTPAVLFILTERFCHDQGADGEEHKKKYIMVLTDRLHSKEHKRIQLIPVYVPGRLPLEAFEKLPLYIRDTHSRTFDPNNPRAFLEKMSNFIQKSPFQKRRQTVKDRRD